MKTPIILVLCTICTMLNGQIEKSNIQPRFSDVNFKIGISGNTFDIAYEKKDQNQTGGISIDAIGYENGDLKMVASVEDFKRLLRLDFRGLTFEFEICRLFNEQSMDIVQILKVENEDLILTQDKPGVYTITWPNAVERLQPFTGAYKMTTLARIEGNFVRFQSKPTFKKKLIPHLVFAGGSAALFAISFPLQNEADRIYNNEYRVQLEEEEAKPLLEEANTKRHQYLGARYAAYGILAIDAVWLLIRHLKHQKDLKNFEEYERYFTRDLNSAHPLTIRPQIEITNQVNKSDFLGLKLNWTF